MLYGVRLKEYDGCGKMVIFLDFISLDVYDGKLLWRWICLIFEVGCCL